MSLKHWIGAATALLLAGGPLAATEITVYNQNLGLVKETLSFDLQRGDNEIKAQDVAAQIDPTSVHFRSLTSPNGVSVLEQDFEYDLLNQDKLLDKYIGKTITLKRSLGLTGEKQETITGVLLSNTGGRVLQVGDKIYVNPPGDPVLPELPEGLVLKPTLAWELSSSAAGRQQFELSYLTAGMNWQADYVLVSNASDDKLDMNSWVTVTNNSGATYEDAKLKLVAGDVHRAEAPRPRFGAKAMDGYGMGGAAAAFAEQSFFEYHLYALQRVTTLRENETKQIELASASDIPVKKRYVYDGAQGWWGYGDSPYTEPGFGTQSQKKVAVTLEFNNSKQNHLGIPLPKGRMRVYKKDDEGSLQFIGEDSITHTPKDELVRIRMGDAFDVTGERTRVNYQSVMNSNRFEESFEIKLRNHKDSDVLVTVVEHPYRWSNWKITDASMQWSKRDAQTIEFEVPVPKDGESTVSYTVKYSW